MITVADCDDCGGGGWVSALNPHGKAVCGACGGSGKVPTIAAFVDVVRALSARHYVDPNQALEWLREQVRRRGAA